MTLTADALRKKRKTHKVSKKQQKLRLIECISTDNPEEGYEMAKLTFEDMIFPELLHKGSLTISANCINRSLMYSGETLYPNVRLCKDIHVPDHYDFITFMKELGYTVVVNTEPCGTSTYASQYYCRASATSVEISL